MEKPMNARNAVAPLPLALALALMGGHADAAERMKSGQWEVSVTESGQTHVSTQCDSPEKVAGTNGTAAEVRASLEKSAASLHCTIQGFKLEGDTISYTYACPGRSTTSTTSYHGDTYESEVTSKSGGREDTRQIKGRRLGACP